jgi:hypothetical protein
VVTGDLVVVVPGFMGSRLTQGGVPVWEPTAGWLPLAVRFFGENVGNLRPSRGGGVEATGIAADLHGIPGMWTPSRDVSGLLRCLRYLGFSPQRGNLELFLYDWRLSARDCAEELARFVMRVAVRTDHSGQTHFRSVVLVCLSSGGLVARWYVDRLGGAGMTRLVVTLGTPFAGTVKAVEQLVNGVPPEVGPFAGRLTWLMRELPSLYELMATYPCVEDGEGALRRVDEVVLPGLDPAMVTAAMTLHRELATAERAVPTYEIVGDRQPTTTALRIVDGRAVPAAVGPGDGTVPAPGPGAHVHRVVDRHGSLQSNPFAHDAIEAALRGGALRYRRGGTEPIGVTSPDFVLVGQGLPVEVLLEPGSTQDLVVEVLDDGYRVVASRRPTVTDGVARTVVHGLEAGGHAVRVRGAQPGSPITPVTAPVVVWDPTTD